MQFLVPDFHPRAKNFEITGDEAFHIGQVLRKKTGDILRLFDGKGTIFWGKIEEIAPQRICGIVLEKPPESQRSLQSLPYSLHLYQALPKGSKWDWVLEKGCELGIVRFVPLISSRTIVRLAASEVPKKMSRWYKVLQAAAKQCGGPRLPDIEEPKNFEKALNQAKSTKDGVILFAWESELAVPIWSALDQMEHSPATLSLFIGPEGGWSLEEVDLAKKAGALLVGLGSQVLRTETAPIAAAAMITALLGLKS